MSWYLDNQRPIVIVSTYVRIAPLTAGRAGDRSNASKILDRYDEASRWKRNIVTWGVAIDKVDRVERNKS